MRIIATLAVIGLSGCVSTTYYEPLDWSTLNNGCYERGISDVLYSTDDFDTRLNLTDILIGRLPDTGNGPGLVVHFRRGLDGFGQTEMRPQIFLAVGDGRNSCSVLLEVSDCPQSTEIYNSFASQSIPIGYAFDDAIGFHVMHSTSYFLSVKEGHGNRINWRYVGSEHPLKDQIDKALDNLSQCAEPAAVAFSHLER